LEILLANLFYALRFELNFYILPTAREGKRAIYFITLKCTLFDSLIIVLSKVKKYMIFKIFNVS